MRLSTAPKFVARAQALRQPALDPESSTSTSERKGKPSPLYALAVVVRIGVLGALLFHAMAFLPW
ncbi:MAG: hypothetical protein DYG89_20930 [Caldilinea sp. CFX5]|nr:hypothetical protein [Caldilinea sp. CFX5]